MRVISLRTLFVLLICFLFIPVKTVFSQLSLVSGLQKGSYHQFANDIKKITDSIKTRSSYGSVDNLNQLMANTKPFVTFLQYDVLINQKLKEKEDGSNRSKSIKILLPLPDEEIHLISRKDSKISNIKDLKGKKVAIGSRKQGTHVTATMIKKITSAEWEDVYLEFEAAVTALLNNEIDAVFFVGYIPATVLKQYDQDANLKLIPITDGKLSSVYKRVIIPSGSYNWQKKRIKSYSVRSVLATNIPDDNPEDKARIFKLLKDIKRNLPGLRSKGHRKWKDADFNFNNIDWYIYKGARQIFNIQPSGCR